MSLFMSKFVEEATSLDALIWEHNSVVLLSKVHALCCCFDALMHTEVQNHAQFNGYFGCPWCMASKEHLEGRTFFTLGKKDFKKQAPHYFFYNPMLGHKAN